MKHRYDGLTFIENHEDERIYIYNFLLNKGYTLEQIEGIEKEEMEIFGTMHTKSNSYKPIDIETEILLPGGKVLDAFTSWIWNSTRLGLHYILLNKSNKLNSYDEIEDIIVKKTDNKIRVWDLYIDYHNKKLIYNN